jgi:PAS domain S-box-containing protein
MLPGRIDRALLILVVFILTGMGVSSYKSWRRTLEMMEQWSRARQLFTRTNDLISALKDAETGERGYVLTGVESYLEPYRQAKAAIPRLITDVEESAGNEEPFAGEAKLLRKFSQDKLAELEAAIDVRREKGLHAAIELMSTHAGKVAMDSIRTVGEDMTSRETDLLAARRLAAERSAFTSFVLTAIGLAVLLVIIVFLQRAVDRGIEAREKLAADFDQARKSLEVTLLSIGEAVIASDDRGRVTLMNPVAEDLTGWNLREAAGQPVESVFRIVNEETREPMESLGVLGNGFAGNTASHTVLLGKQGGEIPIDDTGSPIRDDRNRMLGAVLVFRDVSKRRAQEIQIDKWHRIFQQAGFGVAILVNDGKTILEANEAFATMHGYSPEELADRPFADIVDPDSSYEEAVQKGEDHSVYESLHKKKDGGAFYALTDMTVFRNTAGEPLFRAAYFADISDRKRAEMNLHHSEQRFRAAAEAMGDVIFTANAKGEMVGEQPGWAAFSGQSFEEYQGWGASKTVHPEDTALFKAWEHALADPKKFSEEIRMRRHDGVYRLMSTTAVPVFDEDSSVREWVGALTDISDQRRREEETRESEERFQGLATAFPQLVWSAKPDGHLEFANALWKEYTSIGESASEKAFWEELLHPEDAGPHMERWKESMASGKMFESQARLRRASDGTYRWFICRAVPVRGRDNRIVRWLGACTDINDQMNYADELKQANEALQRSNADLEQFAYAASHDLQEPLRMISLYTQLLREEYAPVVDETARSYVEFAVSGAQRMERLLQDLMAYSRVSAAPASKTETSDATVALQAALGNLEAAIRKSGARFHAGDLPTVTAPSVHLVILFQNLVGNALKYCSTRVPEIWINSKRADEFWEFSISDNGIGIEQKYAKQIFGVFKRLHGAEYEGTGIGLAVCQRIVERTGGKIWLESTPGEGSTFYFTLPRAG